MLIAKYVICALLLVLFSDQSSGKIRLCGKSLTEFMDMVCVDGFNPKNLRAKKSVDTTLDDNGNNFLENNLQSLPYSSLFMNKLFAEQNNLMAKTRRRRHIGIIEECCRDGCTYSEFQTYCL